MAKICIDDETKGIVGASAENEFDETWRCYCGGKFEELHWSLHRGDRKCDRCGQIVEIKGAPEAEEHNAITLSQIPFDGYSDDVIFAWRPMPGDWRGVLKSDAVVLTGPHSPANPKGKRPTSFYRVSIKEFVRLGDLLEHKE